MVTKETEKRVICSCNRCNKPFSFSKKLVLRKGELIYAPRTDFCKDCTTILGAEPWILMK